MKEVFYSFPASSTGGQSTFVLQVDDKIYQMLTQKTDPPSSDDLPDSQYRVLKYYHDGTLYPANLKDIETVCGTQDERLAAFKIAREGRLEGAYPKMDEVYVA